MGSKPKTLDGSAYLGGLVIGLVVPHVFGWLGYGFIFLCHKLRDATSHRDGPSRTATFLTSSQPKNFELIMLGASLILTITVFMCLMGDKPKAKEEVTAEAATKIKSADSTDNTGPAADTDIEAQNGESLKPPPYIAAETASIGAAPSVAPVGDDMIISFSGWRVVVKRS